MGFRYDDILDILIRNSNEEIINILHVYNGKLEGEYSDVSLSICQNFTIKTYKLIKENDLDTFNICYGDKKYSEKSFFLACVMGGDDMEWNAYIHITKLFFDKVIAPIKNDISNEKKPYLYLKKLNTLLRLLRYIYGL